MLGSVAGGMLFRGLGFDSCYIWHLRILEVRQCFRDVFESCHVWHLTVLEVGQFCRTYSEV